MVTFSTFPSQKALEMAEAEALPYMRPNRIPFAVCVEGLIPPKECDAIIERLEQFEGYKHQKCGADITRECTHVPELDNVRDFALGMNNMFWQYDIDGEIVTWLQTYSKDGDYQLHMDGAPGRMRKLTAVTMLTDPDEYGGGSLQLFYHPNSKYVPTTRGTVVIFQPWILHRVHPVTWGKRQTTNTSFWGPNFR